MKILETNRLILRTWQDSDLEGMYQINQDLRVMECFPELQDWATTKCLIERASRSFEVNGYGLCAVELKETGEFIGFVGLGLAEFDAHFTPAVEVGWRLAFEHWNQGYATEAAKEVLNHGFRELKLKEIVSFTAKINLRSQRIMQKIGLKHNAMDDFYHPNLEREDRLCLHILYRLNCDDYLQENRL